MRIAILTFHRAYNCGAMLQAWALRTVLERMGHTVEFPICNHVGETKRFLRPTLRASLGAILRRGVSCALQNLGSLGTEDLARLRYRAFRRRFLPERRCSPEDFPRHYDCVVIGSDQVWSPPHSARWLPLFLGEAIPRPLPLVAYAASYGDNALKPEALGRLLRALPRFRAVSVREETARRQLAEAGFALTRVMADPTLLLTARDYEAIRAPFRLRGKTLYVYTLGASPFVMRTAQALARHLGARPIVTPVYQFSRFRAPRGLTYGVSPDRLVAYVAQADYVLAGSFHGTVLSILFGKPFLSLRDEENPDYPSRPALLLRRLGLTDRLVSPDMDLPTEALARRLTAPLPAAVRDELLPAMRQKGVGFLASALRELNGGGGGMN